MKFFEKLKEVVISSLPLVAIMAIVCCFVFPMNGADIAKLFIGYAMVVLGMTVFLVGLDSSIMPIGKLVGGSLVKLKKAIFIVLFGVVFGLLATVAEPAVSVLFTQVSLFNSSINVMLFTWITGAGVGALVGLALYRTMKNISIKWLFAAFYLAIFILVFFVPESYVALAFDASGATTGDVSVPFILALGLGVSTTLSKTKSSEDSFGIVGLASVGPILAILIMGLFMGEGSAAGGAIETGATSFWQVLLANIGDAAMCVAPIIVIFFLFQFFVIKLPRKQLGKILAASMVVYLGLVVFLTGVTFGFAPAGVHMGEAFVSNGADWVTWLLLPVGFIVGFAMAYCEPASIVLGEQVELITNGSIKKNLIRLTLAIGDGLAVFLAMLKIVTDISIVWLLLPLYAIALILMIFTPKLFVGIAFDSGGVTGGAVASALLTPMALGASAALGQNALVGGLGIIAFISITPILIVEVLGIIYRVKQNKARAAHEAQLRADLDFLSASTNKDGTRRKRRKDRQNDAEEVKTDAGTS